MVALEQGVNVLGRDEPDCRPHAGRPVGEGSVAVETYPALVHLSSIGPR